MGDKISNLTERVKRMCDQLENEGFPIIEKAVWRRNKAIELCKENIAHWESRKANITPEKYPSVPDAVLIAQNGLQSTIDSFTVILKTLEGELDE